MVRLQDSGIINDRTKTNTKHGGVMIEGVSKNCDQCGNDLGHKVLFPKSRHICAKCTVYKEHKFKVGDLVEYSGRVGIVESLCHVVDGTPSLALVDVNDKEMTCTAIESECELFSDEDA